MSMWSRAGLLGVGLLLLAGCSPLQHGWQAASAQMTGQPQEVAPRAPELVTATGYAPISLQPGQTDQHRVLLAMRASKLRAYQELAAVVHGQYLYGTTQVNDMVMENDRFRAAVAGIVRGARVVKTYPVQDDTYATILELDLSQVQRAWVVSEH
ncbi:LPP20 family lipoprotein [Marinobacterium rhizophilum]|uniref:LPP20 family lipoprotein n=1 Tax=Marinobacterium rhizophilum TaxID=420402 RepID=A0ABY5HD96_9GAMM|nr:LPP20 family lipoprotein [Marinobacterium rhizophilum]UTW10305.1 LPP20 family lipoprotein [Marinobacterium rhizophilum]